MAVEHKEEKKKTSEDIVGLNWEGSILALRLTAPDGTVIPGQISETKDIPTTELPTKDEPRLTTMAAKTLLERYQDSWIHGLTNACLQSLLRSF